MWKRVVAPTVVVSILWIAVSFLTSYHLQQIYEAHSRTLTEDFPTVEASWAMRRNIWKLQATVLEQPRSDFQAAMPKFEQLFREFDSSWVDGEKSSLTPEEQKLVALIRTRFDAYRAYIQQIAREGGEPDMEKTTRMASEVADSARNLLEINQEFIRRQARQTRELQSTISVYRTAFLVAGPLLGLLFGLLVARGLKRSLSRIRVTLSGAAGNSGEVGSVAVSTPDDLPALQQQAEIMAQRIRQTVEELEEARRKLVQSERLAAVGELAAGIAHEIRNPLTSVKLLIQAAGQRQPGPTLSPKQFEVVLSEILRMEQTIQGLLDFARPPRLRRVVHDLRHTIQRALNLVQGRADQQKVQLDGQFGEPPIMIDGDPEQLHTVFVNLAINSIEAMPQGGTLHVAAHVSDSVCRITFADTGEGIAPEVLARLFEPFVTSKERGTGLGLAISRRVVQEHGGTLSAMNRAGSGAVLVASLPLASDPRTPAGDVPGSQASVAPISAGGGD